MTKEKESCRKMNLYVLCGQGIYIIYFCVPTPSRVPYQIKDKISEEKNYNHIHTLLFQVIMHHDCIKKE